MMGFDVSSLRFALRASVLVAVVALAGCARAPEPAWRGLDEEVMGGPLSIEECVRLARASDVRVETWKARMSAAEAGIAEARAIPNPTVNLIWEDLGLRDPDTRGKLGTFTYGVSYPILFWWNRPQRIKSARAESDVEAGAVADERRALALEIGTSFLDIEAAERALQRVADLVAITSDSLRLSLRRRAVETASAYDVDRARAELIRARAEEEKAGSELRGKKLAFAFALGAARPCFPALEASGTTATLGLGEAEEDELPPEGVIDAALKADPGWRTAQAEADSAAAKLSIERRSAIPLGDVSGAAQRKNAVEGMARQFTLDLPIPIFNWNRAGIRKAEAELRRAEAGRERARREATAKVALAWQRRRSALTRWREFARPLTEILARNERGAARLFEEGEIEFPELLQVRRDWREANLAEIEAWRDAATAQWELECELGRHDGSE